MPLHTEAQRRSLARPKGDERAVQIAVFPLEVLGLEPGESTADAQVQLLAGVHRQRLVVVRLAQAGHGVTDVCVCDGAEPGPEHSLLAAVGLIHDGDDGIKDLKADVLPFLVTVQPQHDVVAAPALHLQELHHVQLGIGFLLLGRGLAEQLRGVHLVPLVVLPQEVQGHHVTTDGCHLEADRLAGEGASVLVH